MKVSRSARFALLFLAAFLFQTDRFMAFAATVPPSACLYALDPTADRAFQIAGAQTVYTACGVVAESSASDAFEMEGVETLYLENHAQVTCGFIWRAECGAVSRSNLLRAIGCWKG